MCEKCNMGMYCKSCGGLCTYLINGYCSTCWHNLCQNVGEVYTVSPVWYECPDCHGKFTSPIANYDFTYQCPFCGKKMEGFHL